MTDRSATNSRAEVIFVFGSNLRGAHGAKAALDAKRFHGAINGQPEGLQGRSYAIPTCGHHYEPLPVAEIQHAIQRFLEFAAIRPDLTFLVTKVGCGNAGYAESRIAPFFRSAPLNVCLPSGWNATFLSERR